MGNSKMKGAPTLKARMKATLKAMLKALGEDVEEWEETPEGEAEFHEEMTEEEKKKALFENSNPEESGQVPYGLGGNYWTDKYNGITESGRVDGAARESVQKDVQGLANVGEPKEPKPEQNELGDSDVRLDWARQEKAMKMMKAQVIALQRKSDEADFAQWFGQMLTSGRVMPAERDEVHGAYMQALSDDRLSHPVMKSANGQSVSRVRMIQRTIESREPRFGEKQLTPDMMKALGYQLGGFDQTPTEQAFNDKRREELLSLSPLGAKILQDNKRK